MTFKRLTAAVLACTVVMAAGYSANATTDPSDPESPGAGSSPAPPATSSTAPNQCSEVSGESPSADAPSDTQAQAPSGATLTADYGFERSLASSVGAVPDLTAVGDVAAGYADEAVLGRTRPVLTFQYFSGLSLAPTAGVIDSREYTIELLFRFDRIDGWRKILDFNQASADCGLYFLEGRLSFYPIVSDVETPIDADSYVHVVLTRDASGTVAGYVNGSRQFSFNDISELAVIDANDTLLFFRDDSTTRTEYSSGAVAQIKLYDGSLSADEVAELAAELSITPPPATSQPAPPVASVVPDTTAPAPVTNGWVALDSDQSGGGDIYLLRSGEDARRLEVAGSDTADEACPAWSPDGTRLSFGRVTGSEETTFSDAELVIVPVGRGGAIGAATVIALDGFHALDGFDPHPCAIWAPDGRWVAFGGTGEVWVVDTQTNAIRRLPDLRPSDLEWRPGTDQLAIAGDMGTNRAARTVSTPVTVYTVSTGELRQLGSVEAAHLTWSPDGSTLAYKGGENDAQELWLVDADGANERLLVADYGDSNHGIGPVWSPTGERIAYQRLCDHPIADPTRRCSEEHEVVLVSVADGNQIVIPPPQTAGLDGQPHWWYPYSVTWSPDGTTLLYHAWRTSAEVTIGGVFVDRVVAVSLDGGSLPVVLSGDLGASVYSGDPWLPIQSWGRQQGG